MNTHSLTLLIQQADLKLFENLSNNFPMAFKIAVISRQEALLHRAMEDINLRIKVSNKQYIM